MADNRSYDHLAPPTEDEGWSTVTNKKSRSRSPSVRGRGGSRRGSPLGFQSHSRNSSQGSTRRQVPIPKLTSDVWFQPNPTTGQYTKLPTDNMQRRRMESDHTKYRCTSCGVDLSEDYHKPGEFVQYDDKQPDGSSKGYAFHIDCTKDMWLASGRLSAGNSAYDDLELTEFVLNPDFLERARKANAADELNWNDPITWDETNTDCKNYFACMTCEQSLKHGELKETTQMKELSLTGKPRAVHRHWGKCPTGASAASAASTA